MCSVGYVLYKIHEKSRGKSALMVNLSGVRMSHVQKLELTNQMVDPSANKQLLPLIAC